MDATTLPVLASTTTDVVLHPEKMRFGRLVVRNTCRAVARRERPRRDGLPRLHVDHLHRVLALVVDEDAPLAVGRGALGRRVLELDGRHDVSARGIDGRQRANRPAVIREDDLVVGLVVHDAVEAWPHLDLLDHLQRLQVEHRHRLIAAVGREAVAGLRRDPDAVHARGVRNVGQDLAGRSLDHHHVGAPRHEHAARGRVDGDVVGPSVAFDVEFLDLERLCVRDAGYEGAEGEEHGKGDSDTSGHMRPHCGCTIGQPSMLAAAACQKD